ncbi:MAG: UDP-N-acetylmuramoyl-tripeptide--D-alanyl-D-alanine ligase [Patescibacteria group bacterium]
MRVFLRNLVVALLTAEAKLVLRRHAPKIIAVTGSAGKTTTKDAIFVVLSQNGRFVRKSEKSYNSEFGVPLTILGLESGWDSPWRWLMNIVSGLWAVISGEQYPEWLVLEVGADRPGDIRRIAKWLRPDVAVITSIPDIPVHVEYFISPQALAREKKWLAEYLKHDGQLIINGDDAHTKRIHEEFKTIATSFGFGGQNAFVAEDAGILYDEKRPAPLEKSGSDEPLSPRRRRGGSLMGPVGMHFYVSHSGARIPVALYGALGAPRIYAALAAFAVGEVTGVPLEEAAAALGEWEPPPGRMRLLEGIRGSIIIDDTYNSSPAAAHAALDTLKELKGVKKRIAVLGDMLELGRFSKDAHMQVGVHAKKCADLLVTVGFRAKTIGQAALDMGLHESKIRQYEQGESERAGKELEPELREGVVVLVKGSQGMRMEKTVYEIMAEPLRAPELLVRYDEDWRLR